jgi:hypothetical protein
VDIALNIIDWKCYSYDIRVMSGEGSDSEEPIVVNNKFANDGSFLELFKQMQRNSHQLNTNDTNDDNCDHKTTANTDDKCLSSAEDNKDCDKDTTTEDTTPTTTTTTSSTSRKPVVSDPSLPSQCCQQ